MRLLIFAVLIIFSLTGCGAILKTGQSHTFDAESTKARPLASLHQPATKYSEGGAIEAVPGPPGNNQLILRGQLNFHKTIMDLSKSNRLGGVETQDSQLTYFALYITIDTTSGLAVLGTAPVKRYTAVAEKPSRDPNFAMGYRQRAALERSDMFPSVPGAAEGADAIKFYNAAGVDAQGQQRTASERLPNHYGSALAYTFKVYKLDPKALDYFRGLMDSGGCNGATLSNVTLTIANSAPAEKNSCAPATAGAHYLLDLISKSFKNIEWLKPVPALNKRAKEAVTDIGIGAKIFATLGWQAQHSDLGVAKQVGSVEAAEKRIMNQLGQVGAVPAAFDINKPVTIVFWGVPDHPWKKERFARTANNSREWQQAYDDFNKPITYNMSYAEAQKIVDVAAATAVAKGDTGFPSWERISSIGFMDAGSAEPILDAYFGRKGVTPQVRNFDANFPYRAFGSMTEFMYAVDVSGGKAAYYDGELHGQSDEKEKPVEKTAAPKAEKTFVW